jgi:hypothetical protein
MSEIRCYEYVNRPYELVRDALIQDGVGVFQRATTSATSRATALVSTLKVNIAGFDIGKNVVIRVTNVNPNARAAGFDEPATEIALEWSAESQRALFPAMRATLWIYALSSKETQLEIQGKYEPPGGFVGSAADALIGHRIAEASVHRFLDAVASRLSEELG